MGKILSVHAKTTGRMAKPDSLGNRASYSRKHFAGPDDQPQKIMDDPHASYGRYSLPEIVKITGVSASQVYHYADAGLIRLISSNGGRPQFNEADLARIKIIRRAEQSGYRPKKIIELIGHPDEADNMEDPVSACRQFALKKYLQIGAEISQLEPLDRINKQCDLKLITSYLEHLKDIQKRESEVAEERFEKPVFDNRRPLSVTIEKEPQPTMRQHSRSYSGFRAIWFLAGLIFATIGYFLFFGISNEAIQRYLTKTPADSHSQSTVDGNARDPQPPVAKQPLRVERIGKDHQLNEPPAEPQAKENRDNSAIDQPATSNIPPLPSEALVAVNDLSIRHDILNNIYRADFKILKNQSLDDEEPVSGYVFVHLEAADKNYGGKDLLLPSSELRFGKPARYYQGSRFSIRRFKEMTIKTFSTLPPGDFTFGKIWVFSTEGNLLLEKPFSVPIQPYFSTTGER